MLTRGIDATDYFILNATDGSSGSGSADYAATVTYDSIAFNADAVAVEHPYSLIDAGTTPWEALRKIGDASIARYIGMTPDGILALDSAYSELDAEELGDVEGASGVSARLESESANAVKVWGSVIVKETATKLLWSADASGLFFTDVGSKTKHPIDDGAKLEIYGASVFDATFAEDV
jgi:hypothetical protein